MLVGMVSSTHICSKLRWQNRVADHFRYNNKVIDLSRTIRLSGLSSGAKLELFKLSKSPSVISVALQLPESEQKGITNSRLMDKFPSSTSLWQLLRRFESATAGGLGAQKNFTGRGVPSLANGESGAGRLYYESPVLHILGRDYSSLADLQKSLSQLGFNDGSVLLKLSFRASTIPLEHAQKEIEDYFKSLEGDDSNDQVGYADHLQAASRHANYQRVNREPTLELQAASNLPASCNGPWTGRQRPLILIHLWSLQHQLSPRAVLQMRFVFLESHSDRLTVLLNFLSPIIRLPTSPCEN